MSSSLRRAGGWVSRLGYFVPALGVALIAAFIPHPSVLVLLLAAQPLYLAGAVCALGYVLESDFATLALRRGTAFGVLLVTYAAFVALVVGTPVVRMSHDATAVNALWLSAGVALAVLALWRFWPAFGLVFLWDDAYPERDEGSWIATALRRALVFGRHLSLERDPYFVRGLPVAIAVLAVVSGAMALAGLGGLVPSELRVAGLGIWAIVLCPVAYLLLAASCERLLLDDGADDEVSDQQARAEAMPAPALPPADPATRNVQVLAAAAANQVELALALLQQGAQAGAAPSPQDRDQRTLAIIAATCPDLRLLRELIARGADLNRAVGGLTPLLAATRDSYQGRGDAVMTLLTNGADPRAADSEGNTALHYAALSCDATVAAMLIDAHADANVANREGLTPLGMACAAGNELLVRFLLEHGAKTETPRALPALIAACSASDDSPALVKLLLKHRAAVDARDVLGRTALHTAALNGHAEMADALVAAGADIDALDSHGVTALMEAARAGSNRVLQRLVFRKPSPDATDRSGRSALIIACQSRQANEDTVRLIMALGADTTLLTRDGRSAIDYAVAGGRWPVVAMIDPEFALPTSIELDPPGDDAEAPDRLGLLAGALRHGRHLVADELAALHPPLTPPELAQLALTLAGDASGSACAWLAMHGLACDPVLADGTPLLLALARVRPLPFVALEMTLARGAAAGGSVLREVLLAAEDAEPAQRDAHERLALRVLERGADAFVRDARARTSVHFAAALALPALLRELLARGHDPNAADARGRTPLHELPVHADAVAQPLAHALLRAGADPERAAADGQTPLGAALAAGRSQLVRGLSWNGVFRHPARALRAEDLPAAAAVGDASAVEKLLAIGLPLEARDAQGCSALLRACGAGHSDLVAQLLARGASADVAAATGATCLSAAVSARREASVVRLLDHGVPADQPLPGGSTPLMVAAALGLPGIVNVLLSRGAHAAAHDEQGNTALHAAAQFCFGHADTDRCRELITSLLAAGAAADVANHSGQTPLLLLLGARVEAAAPTAQRALAELAGLLLAQGADADAQDQRGVSCLHAAAMHGLLDACHALLRAGADPARQDRLGRTAHEVALMLGYADVAGELRRSRAGPRESKGKA